MVKTLHWHENKIKNRSIKWFSKKLFQVNEEFSSGKDNEKLKKHRDIKLVTTNRRRSKLLFEPKYLMTKWFSGALIAM